MICFSEHAINNRTLLLTLGSTQPLTEMSTSNISWGVNVACAYSSHYHLHVPIVLKSGSLNILEPSGPVQACRGITLPLLYITCKGTVLIAINTIINIKKT
jgi:hypothetical protein